VMMTPREEGLMLQALQIKPTDTILEIGTGSGYITALLAKSGKQVTSLDYFGDFCERSEAKLQELDIKNVNFIQADGSQGWSDNVLYDIIVITGSLPRLSDNWFAQLKAGGRLFAVSGNPPVMNAVLVTKVGEHWQEKKLFTTELAPLINAMLKEPFVF